MGIFDIIACLLTLAAIFGYINHRFIQWPTTIGVMVISLVFSLGLIALSRIQPDVIAFAEEFMKERIDFDQAVLECMLSFLLFAGALHVNLDDLANQKWIILIMASFGVLFSTFLVGTSVYFILPLFGFEQISYLYCLLFGALISPTDPVAVLGLLKNVGVSKSLETKITGESLFNDGIGVVIFLAILGLITSPGSAGSVDQDTAWVQIARLFVIEAGGGLVLGALFGGFAYYLLRTLDNYQVEVLITLALVMGVYSLALALHMSGPLAMVVAGLMIGNHGRRLAMSEVTRDHLDKFWELIDEVLNAVLFVLIGLEILVLEWSAVSVAMGLATIPIVLLARLASVSLPVTALRRFRGFSRGAIRIMTWGGLRGGISVALVLALPGGVEREIFLTMTYFMVIFSIVVQGLTLRALIERMDAGPSPGQPAL